MTTPTTFHAFQDLPSELRIKIWKYALPETRVVRIHYSETLNQYTTTTAPSILLQVCSESRSLFLETYTNLILSPKHESCVFIDFTRDTLFFDSLNCSPDGDLALDLYRSPHRERILRCAIDVQLWEVLRVFRDDSVSEVMMLPNLRTMALVVSRDWGRQTEDDAFQRRHVNTFDTGIMNANWYMDSLMQDLERNMNIWASGVPNVQVWLWE